MPFKNVTLTLAPELLLIIDAAAKANYCTRSDYIREAVVLRLQDQQITKKLCLTDTPIDDQGSWV